jgi:hypothetical protein
VVSCCLLAAGFCFLIILCPPRNWALLTVGLPDQGPDPDGVSTFRTLKTRPGRAPSIARGRWCSSRPTTSTGLHPAHHNAMSLNPATTIHLCEAPLDEPSTRVQAIRPSGLPLARGRRMDR